MQSEAMKKNALLLSQLREVELRLDARLAAKEATGKSIEIEALQKKAQKLKEIENELHTLRCRNARLQAQLETAEIGSGNVEKATGLKNVSKTQMKQMNQEKRRQKMLKQDLKRFMEHFEVLKAASKGYVEKQTTLQTELSAIKRSVRECHSNVRAFEKEAASVRQELRTVQEEQLRLNRALKRKKKKKEEPAGDEKERRKLLRFIQALQRSALHDRSKSEAKIAAVELETAGVKSSVEAAVEENKRRDIRYRQAHGTVETLTAQVATVRQRQREAAQQKLQDREKEVEVEDIDPAQVEQDAEIDNVDNVDAVQEVADFEPPPHALEEVVDAVGDRLEESDADEYEDDFS